MDNADNAEVRMRRKCAIWLSGLCHGGMCPCKQILVAHEEADAEQEQTQEEARRLTARRDRKPRNRKEK